MSKQIKEKNNGSLRTKRSVAKIKIKARLLLIKEGQILLLKQTKPNGGNYTLVGGTVEHDELVRESLVRECQEEAGITLKKSDLRLVHTLHKKKRSETRVVLYFAAVKWKGKPKSLEPKKFKSASWKPFRQLPEPMSPTVLHVLQMYGEGVPFSEIDVRKSKTAAPKY